MKTTHNNTARGILVLISLFSALTLLAHPGPMEESIGAGEPGMMGPRGEPGMERGQRPNPGRMAGQMFHRFDADEDGELAGLELSNATLVMVVMRPPRRMEPSEKELDLKQQAEELEARLIKDFDLDDNEGISMKEFIIALEAIRPGPPPGGKKPGKRPCK